MATQDASQAVHTMARLVAGDATALAELYDQFGGRVHSLARRVTRDEALAEDVTQEVFCQLWQQPHRYRPDRGSLVAYLNTLAHRRAVDCVRSAEAARRRELNNDSARGPVGEIDISTEVAALLEAGDVRQAVGRLPEDQRMAVMLAYFEGYSFRELADHLGIPEGTAKTRVRLGLIKLARALGGSGMVR